MASFLYTRRITATALAGLLAALIGMTIPGLVPGVTALPVDSELPAAEVPEPPRMVLATITHNAGQVERGEMISHTFTFRNTGGSDLVILSTKAG